MPVKSKAQLRLLEALIHGSLRNPPPGLTKQKAQEFINKTPNFKTLPDRIGKKKNGI